MGENYVYDLGSITYISEFLICYHRYRQENLFNFRLITPIVVLGVGLLIAMS